MLALYEIEDLISNGTAKSTLLEDAAMKELVWGDQWVGYDDRETIELKKKFANDQCFGGIMTWSVDFDSSNDSVVSGLSVKTASENAGWGMAALRQHFWVLMLGLGLVWLI